MTAAQVTALAEHDLRLLVEVDYRHFQRAFDAAEAVMTPELRTAAVAAYTTGAPDPRGQLRTETDLATRRVVDAIQAITSVKTDISDPAYPVATLMFTVLHREGLSGQPSSYPARIRLTFANVSGRWLVADEQVISPGP